MVTPDTNAPDLPALTPEEAVRANIRLVHWAIRRSPRARSLMHGHYDDMVQVGLLALARAAADFDPARGSFGTYAAYWLRAMIERYCANHATVVRTPVHAQERARKLGQRGTALVWSLNSPVNSESLETHLDLLADGAAPDLDEAIDASTAPRRLATLIAAARLTPRERRVLRLRAQDRTLAQIGAALGVSREYVRQIEARAMKRLRRAAGKSADAP